ncbi:MAG: hypothetical protein P8K69_06045, partial [Flavobacteriales bacterium]|nr:hypothetical protein [Flavobacteriales bacterium]
MIYGCMDMSAMNYNPDATSDDGSCEHPISGCTDENAMNYNPDATSDDGSCDYNQQDPCILPTPFNGNTGTNMTLMLLGDVFSSLPDLVENSYVVAVAYSGLVVGSADVFGVTQNSIAVWGDDSSTPEVDGAVTGELINYYLVNGDALYMLEFSWITADGTSYINSGLNVAGGASVTFVCSQTSVDPMIYGCMDMSAMNYNPDATTDNGSCEFDVLGCMDMTALNYNPDATTDNGSCNYDHSQCSLPQEFEGNTGLNMTVFLTSGALSDLPLTSPNPYVVALTSSGLIIGSASLAQDDLINGQQSIAVWGDDTQTPEVDGAGAGEELYFQLVDGNSLFDLDISFAGPNTFTGNGTLPAIGVTTNFVCSQDELGDIFGCMDMTALNYNPNATVDNESCDYESLYECPILDFSYVNTGLNMTLLFDSTFVESHNIQIGQMIGVFANTENDQTPICYGSSEWTGTQFSIAVWGDDVTTPEIDGFQTGDTINIGYQLSAGTVLGLESNNIVFNPNAIDIISSGSFTEVCSPFSILGCTDISAINYNPDANFDDGSCDFAIFGCTDISAINYNTDANFDDGSCDFEIFGCTDISAINYNSDATVDNGSCEYEYSGCVFPNEFSGNTGVNMTVFLTSDVVSNLPITSDSPYVVATTNSGLVVGSSSLTSEDLIDGQQYLAIFGDDTQTSEIDGAVAGDVLNFQLVDGDSLYDLEISFAGVNAYTTNAVLPGLSVSYNFNCSPSFGCTDENAFNYDEEATMDNGSCVAAVYGCTDDSFLEFNPSANINDGSCLIDIIYGCTSVWFIEYDENANVDDGSCITLANNGCTDSTYLEYDVNANVDDGSCITLIVEGCTDESADNFNFDATLDDGSCTYTIFGCTDSNYVEYNPLANVDNSSCLTLILEGCMDFEANNYNFQATVDDGSCTYSVFGCTDITYLEYNPLANVDNNSCITTIVEGCTDPTMFNFNPNANSDDNSCIMKIFGCTSPSAFNYNSYANVDDGS